MANSVPSLSNYNYHMFEPSPIETSLAASVDNPATPSAFPLLMAYRAQNQQGNAQYQDNIDQMHQLQAEEGIRAQKTQLANSFLTSLPHLALPGAAQAASSAGVLPDGTDLTGLAAGGQQAADAKNMSEMLTGLGHAGQGNVNVPDATIQPLVPGAHMGPNPLIASTAMKEAGAMSRHNSGEASMKYAPSLNMGVPGGSGDSITVKMRPGETPDSIKTRLGVPSLHSTPTVPGANTRTPTQSPLTGPRSDNTGAGGADNGRKYAAVNTVRGLPPDAQRDVLAAATQNNNSYKIVTGPQGEALMGISGQLYPLGVG